jgi:hypothetical protein
MTGWTWRYHAADGSTIQTGTSPTGTSSAGVDEPGDGGFPSQADAETWVGESWRELLDAGVESVSLLRDGELVYGPMSLRPLE